ncbi:hypothetical protein Tco_0685920 [Tanacetum coccineum]
METYKNVSQDIQNQLDDEAEAIQIILTLIDNDIYSTVYACPNACEIYKAIERLKQGESINVQDLETNLYWEFGKFTSRDGESLESYYLRFYKMMNELRFVTLVKQSQELKTVSYHKLYDILKQHHNEVNELRVERLAHTTNPLALIQEVTQDATDNSRPIFDVEPLQKVQTDNDNYNVFANDREHLEQPKTVSDTYLDEQECYLLASLIEKLKSEIDDSNNRNKLLESSNKILVDKLTSQIGDFRNTNKSLESLNTHFKEANNELPKTNQLMFKDLKTFQGELRKRHDVNYMSKVELDCAKEKTELMSYKMES